MSQLKVELCPETGICSIFKDGGGKVDLLPHEVRFIREAKGDSQKIKTVIAECNQAFADNLDSEEIGELADNLK